MRDERPMSEAAIEALVLGRHGDPFALLGPHRQGEGWVIRALLPGARAVTALARSGETEGIGVILDWAPNDAHGLARLWRRAL